MVKARRAALCGVIGVVACVWSVAGRQVAGGRAGDPLYWTGFIAT